ncbi:MAG: anaerobic ribonucleoside-triphosphate reductase activating protein [Bacteroidota bacterium]|nr:anaerobic ribonucleoside-triphosphate reductase activating protein [Bacteroidota bacterium]
MRLAYFQKVSLIDYPGKISSVIFTQGCNFRCGFCHNPQLVLPELFEKTITKEEIFEYLKRRKGKIEAVVVTGGEPSIHQDLPDLLKEIKELGYCVKLDTNGTNPKMLKDIINNKFVDFIAMDIKTVPEKYDDLCGVKVNINDVIESINIIKNSSIEKQFRITLVKGYHTKSDLEEIKGLINSPILLQYFNFTGKHISDLLSEVNMFKEEEKL